MSDTSHDPDRLSARLAAVERALTDRDCDCAHAAFEVDGVPVSTASPTPTTGGDSDLRVAVDALCAYVLARERANGTLEERVAAVAAAREGLDVAPGTSARATADSDTGTAADDTPAGPREWLERVSGATFE